MVLEQSGSSSVAVKSEGERELLKKLSSSTATQSIVKVKAATVQRSRSTWWVLNWKMQRKIVFWTKEQNLGYAAGTIAALGLPAFLLGPLSWFPGCPGASLAPWLSCSFVGCCSESEDSLNLLWIQHSNSLWFMSLLFFLYFEFISRLGALHSVLNSLYVHTLPKSKLYM